MIPFFTLLRREVARFLKVAVQTVITPFVSSGLYILVFGVSLGANIQLESGVSYLAFLIPGLMMLGILNNAFQNSSSSIVNAKFTGELEDLRVVPVSRSQLIWALSFGSVVRGSVVGLITYFVGGVFLYLQEGVWLSIAHPLELIFFVVVSGLIFGKLGIFAAFYAKTFDQLSAVSAFVILPLTYLGGVFISIQHLSPFWQQVASLNPLLYLINGLRHAILGESDVQVLPAILLSLIGLVLFHILARISCARGSFHRW
ncbi:MAG: ABC transporter permease [Proteobacteria bacterium]|jgi:ABC-2 type transport system permease protein|nr:ABC transporter permease [Pseudomonadota bacterium]